MCPFLYASIKGRCGANDQSTSSSPSLPSRSSPSFYYPPSLTAASMWGSPPKTGYPVSSTSFAYPPTPPIDMKSEAAAAAAAAAANGESAVPVTYSDVVTPLPSIASIDASKHNGTDPIMPSLGFGYASPSLSGGGGGGGGSGATSNGGARKLHHLQEGTSPPDHQIPSLSNSSQQSISSSSSSSTVYPYFAAPTASNELSNPLYGSYSTTGVFSAKTLQPARPRAKSRANAGKS